MASTQSQLTVTAVQSQDGKAFTAFINEMPGILAQGSSLNDVSQKLRATLDCYIQYLNSSKQHFDIQTKTLA